MVARPAHPLHGVEHAGVEVVVVHLLPVAPANLGDGQTARPEHVLEVVVGHHVLAPEIALHAQDHALHVGAQRVGRRVVAVDVGQRDERSGRGGLDRGVVLAVVEVAVAARRHDGLVAAAGCGDASLDAAPRHDRGVGRQTALEDLVPADQSAASGVQVALDAAHEVALQLVDILQSLAAHALPALGAGAPVGLGRLVAADVDILRGEEPDHLVEHVFEELERRLAAHAEVRRGVGLARAREGRVDGQHLLAVARHLDLGDHLDVALAGILHHLADVVLGVETAVRLGVVAPAVAGAAPAPCGPVGVGAPGGDLRELGIAVDRDAPARGVGQVPVHAVELVAGHQVELLHDELLRAEVARDVEHQAAPGEARGVGDLHRGDAPAEAVGHLQQRLHAVEDARGVGCGDLDPPAVDA